MSQPVEITFDCLPLRSIARFDVPLDAPPEYEALVSRIKGAVAKHGMHNAYFLYNASCVYHLTNAEDQGMLEFRFEGTVLTDPDDERTLSSDLSVNLARDTCDWITEPVVAWFGETVGRAVRVEFDRFIADGDLEKTIRRIEQLQVESDARGGFLGMGL